MASAFEAAGRPAPAEIRLKSAEQMLEVDFGDGSRARYSAEYLRVMSPSAEVQGHGPSSRVTVPGKRNVKIKGIDPVGTYAVRLTFDDGHDTACIRGNSSTTTSTSTTRRGRTIYVSWRCWG